MLFLLFQTLFLDLLPISDQATLLRIIGTTIYLAGLGTSIIGRLQLGNNWAVLEDYQILLGQVHIKTGIYRYIRHPIYTGDILVLLGLELALNSWLVMGVLIVIPFVVRQAMREEALLSGAFAGYNGYCTQTKKFIPFVY